MRDKGGRYSVGSEFPDDLEQPISDPEVEGRGRFIEQQHSGRLHERANNGAHLADAEPQRPDRRLEIDVLVEQPSEAGLYPSPTTGGLVLGAGPVRPARVGRCRARTTQGRGAPPGTPSRSRAGAPRWATRSPRMRGPGHNDFAAIGPDEPRQDLDQRALAAAVLAHEHQDLAAAQGEGARSQSARFAVGLGDCGYLEDHVP